MKVTSLSVFNFRNWTDGKIEFDDKINILVGNNAQGKTNLLEAIYFCCIGKSLRAKDKELVQFEKENGKITLNIQKKFSKPKIEVYLFRKQKKSVKINNIPINRIGQLMGEVNMVYFSPDELKLVKETPEDRRRFLDIHLSQMNKSYFYELGIYNKILNNRNKLLKTAKSKEELVDTLPIWNEKLAQSASKIISWRLEFIEKLKPIVKNVHCFLSDNNESINLVYSTNIDTNGDIKTQILKKLENDFEKECILGYTATGPHRDDIKITLNGKDVKNFASQGQQRSCALSLKLAEIQLIKDQVGENPVLLLDDVFSELDLNRREKLLEFAKDVQTIITCTDIDKSVKNCKIIKIHNGQVLK